MMIIRIIRLIFMVSALMFCGAIGYLTVKFPTTETWENRPLIAAPVLPKHYHELSVFFKGVDMWLSDHMHFRLKFLSFLNETRRMLGVSRITDMVVGKNGWYFFAAANEPDDARGTTRFSDAELQQWKNYLVYRDNEVRSHGGKYIFLLIPNKSTVYSEFLPDNFKRMSDNTRIQQLVDVMRDSSVEVIDARAVLSEGKLNGQVYLQHDSHWNLLGANYVQHLVMQRLVSSYPHIHPKLFLYHEATDDEKVSFAYPEDLLFMAGLRSIRAEDSVPIVDGVGTCVGQANPGGLREWPPAMGDCSTLIKQEEESAGWKTFLGTKFKFHDRATIDQLFHITFNKHGQYTLLMSNDSYFEMLQPFFSNQFRHVYYVGLGRPIDKDMWTAMIEGAHPDVVIEEILERNLKHSTPQPEIDYIEIPHAGGN